MRWAMIDNNNTVYNIIVWDGQGNLFEGMKVVQLEEGEWCDMGSLFTENATPRFTPQEQSQETP